MRKLFAILIVIVPAYVGWYYWTDYTDGPLRTQLLRTPAAEIAEVRVNGPSGAFRMFRRPAGGEWVVARGNLEVYDRAAAVERLVGQLAGLRSDSVVERSVEPATYHLDVTDRSGRTEGFDLYFTGPGPPQARRSATGDVFALPPAAVDLAPALRFAAYRGRRTLRLAAAGVDSVVVVMGDSLRQRLVGPGRTPLLTTLLAPALAPTPTLPAPFATHFDEIAHRDRHRADVLLYEGPRPHRIAVYTDTLWPRPLVLLGEDFPRRPFALDSLPGEIGRLLAELTPPPLPD